MSAKKPRGQHKRRRRRRTGRSRVRRAAGGCGDEEAEPTPRLALCAGIASHARPDENWVHKQGPEGARGRACRCNRRPLFIPCPAHARSEEHTSELQSLMRISYAVFCLKKKTSCLNDSKRQ